MRYITAEQFLEQPKEVQKVLLEWWKPEIGDVFALMCDSENSVCVVNSAKLAEITNRNKGDVRIPLLNLQQLIEFIDKEDKEPLQMEFWDSEMVCYGDREMDEEIGLLNNLWTIACEIAQEVANETNNAHPKEK